MNKIFTKDNTDGHLLDSYTVSSPYLAIEQFKELMNRRIPNACLFIAFDNRNVWQFDIQPKTPDSERWKAKDDPFSGESQMPNFTYSMPEIVGLFKITRATVTRWKRTGQLVEFFDYIMGVTNSRSAYLYDPKSIEKILAEKPRNKKL